MRFPYPIAVLLLSLSVFSQTDLAAGRAKSGPKSAEVIRVGVTEYQNVEESYSRYEKLFKELANSSGAGESVTFSFAIGTYGEVLNWYNSGAIDVAILSAMPVADLLLANEAENLKDAYIGDLSVPSSSLESERSVLGLYPAQPKNPFTYRTGCIVLNSDTKLRTVEDLKALWNQGQVKFLFVRPYSMSGYIAPLYVLRNMGIDALKKPEQIEFTYQHPKSLERMIQSLSEKQSATKPTHLVAFVLDDTRYDLNKVPKDLDAQQTFFRIPIPDLDKYSIPREVMLANYNQQKDLNAPPYANKFEKTKALMMRLVQNWRTKQGLRSQISWRSRPETLEHDYEDIKTVLQSVHLPRQLLYKSNFDDLLKDLKRTPTRRLALVLSGGGAKCSYQAGAIIEIEKKLEAEKLGIDLVVGTSGGAINALLVAMKATGEKDAEKALFRTWGSFRQQQFLQPSGRFNIVFGLCFGLLQALLITVAVLLFDRETMHWMVTLRVLGGIAIVEVCVAQYFQMPIATIGWFLGAELVILALTIGVVYLFDYLILLTKFLSHLQHWRSLTVTLMLAVSLLEVGIAKVAVIGGLVEHVSNHWIQHTWLVITLISVWSFPYPLVIGVAMAIIGWRIARGFDWTRWREPVVWWMTIILVFFSGLLVLEGLFKESAPSKVEGIEQAFTEQIPALIRATVDKDFVFSTMPGKTSLEALSQKIMDGGLLKRDVIITASKLPGRDSDEAQAINLLPDDLYFYFRSNTDPKQIPPPERRFVPLKYNPDKLLDIVIGSSTIYPIFPSRSLKGIELGNEQSRLENLGAEEPLKIVDGGYIHNTPLEAATEWGATHIIVINASPSPQQHEPRDFWDNAGAAFGYLFSQAQRGDTTLHRAAETFELRPTSKCERLNIKPMCSDTDEDGRPEPDLDTFDFFQTAVENAFQKGKDDASSASPLFIRVPGVPIFRIVTADPPSLDRAPAVSPKKPLVFKDPGFR